ncbi:TetR/AcrR family transcriptional regulator [Halodesulfovibrio aestuarii]|uniref:Transcriptional regulator, TetR family n=1 Tax=Halodesulfovibrio aestuarii TaxID=126333 RepID=A0A8G2CB26_9BACT|nr:TetR/AcrR family transcriptional regulator [Halodesulfovibrio aestuarii]SHJ46389.1 transcriptional regulator, TetR family [Halodesulfovibrio aestuarii]
MNNTLRTNPQQERAITTIDKILEASKRVLISEGYEKFTTNRVATASSLNIGTIYRYFPDKEKIIIQLYKKRLEESISFLTTYLANTTTWNSADEFLGQLLKEYIESHSDEDHTIAVELTKAAVMNQHIHELDKTHDEQTFSLLCDALEERFALHIERSLIQFIIELGLHLALMVSMQPKGNRATTSERAVATIIAAVHMLTTTPVC